MGYLSPTWVQILVWNWIFQFDWTSRHAMRLNSRTGIERLPCQCPLYDRPLHLSLKAPELVMDVGCRDNRWTTSLCTWPPGCSPLVLRLARRWAVLEHRSAWLVVNTQVKACSRETHSLSWASKIYGHKAFQITHLYATVLSTVATQHYSTPHTLWRCTVELASALTVATILTDAAVTPTVSEMTNNGHGPELLTGSIAHRSSHVTRSS